jgi:hypothetical protein
MRIEFLLCEDVAAALIEGPKVSSTLCLDKGCVGVSKRVGINRERNLTSQEKDTMLNFSFVIDLCAVLCDSN